MLLNSKPAAHWMTPRWMTSRWMTPHWMTLSWTTAQWRGCTTAVAPGTNLNALFCNNVWELPAPNSCFLKRKWCRSSIFPLLTTSSVPGLTGTRRFLLMRFWDAAVKRHTDKLRFLQVLRLTSFFIALHYYMLLWGPSVFSNPAITLGSNDKIASSSFSHHLMELLQCLHKPCSFSYGKQDSPPESTKYSFEMSEI